MFESWIVSGSSYYCTYIITEVIYIRELIYLCGHNICLYSSCLCVVICMATLCILCECCLLFISVLCFLISVCGVLYRVLSWFFVHDDGIFRHAWLSRCKCVRIGNDGGGGVMWGMVYCTLFFVNDFRFIYCSIYTLCCVLCHSILCVVAFGDARDARVLFKIQILGYYCKSVC